jgi:hypothetical protein
MTQYQLAIVTFLDILGFRDLVMQTDAAGVASKLEALKRFAVPRRSKYSSGAYEPIALQFSDSIVRVRRVHTKENRQYPIGLLFHELIDLVHAQGELIREGVLVRGGVSFGQVHASRGQVFGPAFVAAYDLETEFALHPRIVIDPTLVVEYRKNPLLKASHHDIEDDVSYVGKLVRRGDDGIWFVDYLRAFAEELDEPETHPIFLKAHRHVILEGARRLAKTPLSSPISKYLWLASYHNGVVSELSAKWFTLYSVKKRDLLVNATDMAALQDFRRLPGLRQRRR